jgi:hypothetical protein
MKALLAAATGNTRLEGDTLAERVSLCTCASVDDDTGCFVSEHEWIADDRRPDSAVLVVVNIRAANTDGSDLDENIPIAQQWGQPIFDADISGAVKHRRDYLACRHDYRSGSI